jgi:hypothetical protein
MLDILPVLWRIEGPREALAATIARLMNECSFRQAHSLRFSHSRSELSQL